MEFKDASGVGIKSNSTGKKIKFGIKEVGPIINILRNKLYSNPIQTLVQEYISNGRDATREMKKKTALKITMPNQIESVFKVRDYGPGLTPDRIEEVFVNYGSSTKRHSNEQTGGFGIGAKSAWAYTDTFTIVTYLDGLCYTYVAHIGTNSEGELDMMGDPTDTKEPNGTEIQIAVNKKDIEDFINAAYRATMFWDVKPTFEGITDPEIPDFYSNMNCVMKRDNWAIYKGSDLANYIEGTSYNYKNTGGVVMVVDGIPYKLTNKLLELPNVKKFQSYLNGTMIIAIHVGNGDVEVAANREAIADKEFSQNAINEVSAEVLVSIEKQIKEELKKATDFDSYAETHRKLNQTLNNAMETEKEIGKTLYSLDGKNVLKAEIFDHVNVVQYILKDQVNGKVVSTPSSFSIYVNKNSSFFFQDDLEEGPGKTRERVRKFFGGDTSKSVYLFCPVKDGSMQQFHQLITEVNAQPVTSLELPVSEKSTSQRVSNKGKVCLHYLSSDSYRYSTEKISTHILPSEIDPSVPHLYVEMVKGEMPESCQGTLFKHFIRFVNSKGYKVVAVSTQVKSKVEVLPNFTECVGFMKDLTSKIPLSELEENSIKASAWKGVGSFGKLDNFRKEIKDKNIREILKLDDEINELDRTEIPEKIKELYSGRVKEIHDEIAKKHLEVAKLEKKYPLVGAVSTHRDEEDKILKELVSYINYKLTK